MWWRGIVMMMLGGVGMATGASAFVVPLLPGRRELVGRGPALRATCPAMQSVQRAGRARVSMDAEGARVAVVRSEDQWHELVAIAAEIGSTLVVFFKKDFCRKCAAMKPKFAKLASEYVESDALWAEVDGVSPSLSGRRVGVVWTSESIAMPACVAPHALQHCFQPLKAAVFAGLLRRDVRVVDGGVIQDPEVRVADGKQRWVATVAAGNCC